MTSKPKPAPEPTEGSADWSLTVPEPIAPGVYDAKVTAVELRLAEADGREWLAWSFVLDDGRQVGGGSSFSISPRSKAFAWLTAVVGRRTMAGGRTLTAVDLIGRPCTVAIVDDAEGFAKVDAVLPPRGGHPTPSIDELVDELPAG